MTRGRVKTIDRGLCVGGASRPFLTLSGILPPTQYRLWPLTPRMGLHRTETSFWLAYRSHGSVTPTPSHDKNMRKHARAYNLPCINPRASTHVHQSTHTSMGVHSTTCTYKLRKCMHIYVHAILTLPGNLESVGGLSSSVVAGASAPNNTNISTPHRPTRKFYPPAQHRFCV